MSRFLLDENIPHRISDRLRQTGHDVIEATAPDLRGSRDEELWKLAAREGRIFVTRDERAAGLRVRPQPPAVVLLRVPDQSTAAAIDALFAAFWGTVDPARLSGHLVSVRHGRYRYFRLR